MLESMRIRTRFNGADRLVFFPSNQQRNRLLASVQNPEKSEEDIDVQYDEERFSTKYGYIRSIVYPLKCLVGDEDQSRINLELIFQDGSKCVVPILGKNRASNMFREVRGLQHQAIPDKDGRDGWIKIMQDKVREALIRWDSVLTEIYCTEITNEDSIDE